MVYVVNIYKDVACICKKREREKGSWKSRDSTPMEEVGPVWLVRRCETLAANAAILDNMWSKPVADRSKVEFHVIISSREEESPGKRLASFLDGSCVTFKDSESKYVPRDQKIDRPPSNYSSLFLLIRVYATYLYVLN